MIALYISCRKTITEEGRGGEDVEKGVEAELVVQALRLNTLSKLTFADSSRYKLIQHIHLFSSGICHTSMESLLDLLQYVVHS